MSLRITGGDLRGRPVQTPEGNATRPTASRVREAVFSMLGPLHGARVLDLCCGGGTLAFEAISRGAEAAVLVDADDASIACAQRNAEVYGVRDQVRIVQLDVVVAALRLADEGERFDIVFLDAPYRLAPRIAARLDGTVGELLAPGGRVVLEGDRRDPPRLSLPVDRERTYRDVLVQILDAPQAVDQPDRPAGA